MEDVEAYVRHAARLQGLQLDDAALHRVTEVFQRNAALADLVNTFDLDATQEAAPVFEAGG